MLYRPDVIPACADAVGSWREHFRRDHGLDPIIVMAQTFGTFDPGPLGFDGALEFPPHKLGFELDLLSRRTDFELYDIDFRGWVHDYEQIVGELLALPASKFPLIKTAFPSWDNDARTQGAGMSFANSTPRAFQRWLEGLIELAQKRPFFGEPFVCINAWNEWCEGHTWSPMCISDTLISMRWRARSRVKFPSRGRGRAAEPSEIPLPYIAAGSDQRQTSAAHSQQVIELEILGELLRAALDSDKPIADSDVPEQIRVAAIGDQQFEDEIGGRAARQKLLRSDIAGCRCAPSASLR